MRIVRQSRAKRILELGVDDTRDEWSRANADEIKKIFTTVTASPMMRKRLAGRMGRRGQTRLRWADWPQHVGGEQSASQNSDVPAVRT